MAKRSQHKRKPLTPSEQRQKRRVLIAGAIAVVLVVLMIAAANNFFRTGGNADGDHPHDPAAHGGVIVALEGDRDDHYHVEALLEQGGVLKLFTFGEEVTKVVEVESQVLTARFKTTGAEEVSVLLMPVPRPSDTPGKTSHFSGKVPPSLIGKPLVVSVASLKIAGKEFPVNFEIKSPAHDHEVPSPTEDEEKLYLTPGGKYTERDIAANGNLTVSRKYEGFKAEHGAKPEKGDRLCPVSRMKADAWCAWIVGEKSYQFCCPPCIEEFVKRAKHRPEEVKDPEQYVKR